MATPAETLTPRAIKVSVGLGVKESILYSRNPCFAEATQGLVCYLVRRSFSVGGSRADMLFRVTAASVGTSGHGTSTLELRGGHSSSNFRATRWVNAVTALAASCPEPQILMVEPIVAASIISPIIERADTRISSLITVISA